MQLSIDTLLANSAPGIEISFPYAAAELPQNIQFSIIDTATPQATAPPSAQEYS